MNNDNTNNGNTFNQLSNNESNTAAARIADHSGENKLPAPDKVSDASHLNAHTTGSAGAIHQKGTGGRLELLEERPVVNKERLDVGKVTVTKHARTKTITVPIELIEEYITVRTEYANDDSQALLVGNYNDKDIVRHIEPSLDHHAVVTINGKQVEVGDEAIEIVISRQVAIITKDTHVIQEVEVNKTTHVHTDNLQVEVRHEELDVYEEGFLDHEGTVTHHHNKLD